jgi:hypothetical protein
MMRCTNYGARLRPLVLDDRRMRESALKRNLYPPGRGAIYRTDNNFTDAIHYSSHPRRGRKARGYGMTSATYVPKDSAGKNSAIGIVPSARALHFGIAFQVSRFAIADGVVGISKRRSAHSGRCTLTTPNRLVRL